MEDAVDGLYNECVFYIKHKYHVFSDGRKNIAAASAEEKLPNDKFYDLYMQGKVQIEDLDTFLEEWHQNTSSEAVDEYLGLTEEQYYMWCDDPDKLKNELDMIKAQQPVSASRI